MHAVARQLVRSSSCLPAAARICRTAAAFTPTAALAAPALARSTSSLPVIDDYVRRSYPFPTILESDIPADYSKWLYFHKQFPTDLPRFKSKVTVDIRDLGLDPHSRMALREIVGPRYNRRTHTVSFVSRTLATAQANENRVFQMLDLALIEARTLGKQMQEDGIPASQSGAENNRLLKAVPSEASVKQQQLAARRVKLNELRVAAGKKPIAVRSSAATDEQAGDAAAAVDEAARTPKMTRALRAALDIGLTREEKEVICDIAGRTAAQEQQQQQ